MWGGRAYFAGGAEPCLRRSGRVVYGSPGGNHEPQRRESRMDITITFESAVARESVAIHAWEPLGHVWDVTARESVGRRFTFRLQGTTADARTIQFKFRFPGERRWEPDDYVRHVP